VHRDGFADELFGFFMGGTRCADAWQCWHIGAPSGPGPLVHDSPGGQRSSLGKPTCLRMLPSVPARGLTRMARDGLDLSEAVEARAVDMSRGPKLAGHHA
jgi:hypothetical protein